MKLADNAHAVSNWIWQGKNFHAELSRGTSPGEGLDPARMSGHFALHVETGDGLHRLMRDRLGVNKLFFALDAEGNVHSSNFLIDLRRLGFPLSAIQSVPSGHEIRIDPARETYILEAHSSLRFASREADDQMGLEDHAAVIRSALESTFERLAAALRGRQVFVTLSGGLDSTTIAALAHRWLDGVVAVTFDLGDEGRPEDPTNDLASARRVAESLGMPLRIVRAKPEELSGLLDTVLVWGQDWRDFNVHCGLVNAAIARGLRAIGAGDRAARPVVLTGDTMNELMADYSAESYAGEEHYALPRLGMDRLRRSLVEGLDSGDREVGIFAYHGFDTVQPYAICAGAYAALPAGLIASAHSKQDLVRAVMGDAIPEHVYQRPKVRAQVGSSGGVTGTLAAMVDEGRDRAWLQHRFASLFDAEESEVAKLIRAGIYRMTGVFPERYDLSRLDESKPKLQGGR